MLLIFYNFLTFILYIPFIFLTFIRIFLKKEHSVKYKEKIFFTNYKRPNGFLFWFHVASIGEFKSILPIIEFYLKQNPRNNFLITTVTLSSYNEYKKLFDSNNRVYHQFMPFDLKFLINNFFKNWQPDFVSFVDSEIWPNFIMKIKKNRIPLILLNARITQKSFLRWNAFNKTSKKIFNSFSTCISSSEDTSKYLTILGAKNIKFFGNIKFCSSPENNIKNEEQFKSVRKKKIWCALSTHSNEEIFCGKVHLMIKKRVDNILTIIIPRHVHRIEKIYANLKDLGLKVQIKSEEDSINDTADIVLVNYYGSVNKYLRNINQVFIGKSTLKKFENSGGQNPIDAAKNSCFIYHGQYVYNFKDIYKLLNEFGIAQEILNTEDLARKLEEKLSKNIEVDENKINEINNFSKNIFENTIKEYNKYLK